MSSSSHALNSPSSTAPNFALTRWSVVLAAGQTDSTNARGALENLCRAYWPPLYAFVRRQGHNPADAQDLTQEFFARLLQKNYLGAVDPAKGRFRSFLLASLKHFLANEWDKARAVKRGGGAVLVPINTDSAETACGVEPSDQLTPEKLFERRWALTLLEQVLARLRAEHLRDGKAGLFEQLKATLTGERTTLPYAQIASRLGMSEVAIKVTVHRLRQRYREILREQISHTVSAPDQIEDEIRSLFSALS
jgi:RNA polymerase sigma-70 factor (ECF subfamily)